MRSIYWAFKQPNLAIIIAKFLTLQQWHDHVGIVSRVLPDQSVLSNLVQELGMILQDSVQASCQNKLCCHTLFHHVRAYKIMSGIFRTGGIKWAEVGRCVSVYLCCLSVCVFI